MDDFRRYNKSNLILKLPRPFRLSILPYLFIATLETLENENFIVQKVSNVHLVTFTASTSTLTLSMDRYIL